MRGRPAKGAALTALNASLSAARTPVFAPGKGVGSRQPLALTHVPPPLNPGGLSSRYLRKLV